MQVSIVRLALTSSIVATFALSLALGGEPVARPDLDHEDTPTPHARDLARTTPERAAELGCLSCHEGIEEIREESSGMMVLLKAMGNMHGDPGGCVVCHGGRPDALTAEEAHQGVPATMSVGPKTFYRDPGSMFVAQETCGQCHPDHVYRVERSLMNTEAGKIQGNLHTWGVDEVQDCEVPWGNYDVDDPDGPVPLVGTPAYKEYMGLLMEKYPKQFPSELTQIPLPSYEEIEENPHLAGFTYQRQQCQRCHVTVRGREKRGDFRGMGCSACHVLYGNDGYYEGGDPTIDKDEPGHLLTHRIHGTREAGNGIPVETCNSCHNRGKRIGVTYQGLMEFPYGSPFDSGGGKQSKLHTKQYLFISDDLHHQVDQSRPGNPKGGMLCQDCHTTIDMHGDGNIPGTTLAQVEIECEDCHGTTEKYPWELPLGWSEEHGRVLPDDPRGLADRPAAETIAFGTTYDRRDGFLLSARGNPLGNVVKDGDKVILHSATGSDFEVPILKYLKETEGWSSPEAEVAMARVQKHNQAMECYTCHASWVPQCYGCHVSVDYSEDPNGVAKTDIDWIASGSQRTPDGETAESRLGEDGLSCPGKVAETRSYLRWEEPVLGINGEGRVSPLMPGCQVVFSVIGKDGEPLLTNHIADAPDEARHVGQDHIPLAIDMAPVQPHSAQRKARTCESCHNNPKTMGYGIAGGVFQTGYPTPIVEDLIDQRTGEVIPKRHTVQIQAIPKLDFDWSTIVDDVRGQVATVGTHWPLSRALNAEERAGLTRTGLCMGCHREMSDQEFWEIVSTPGRLDDQQHIELMNQMLRAFRDQRVQAEEAGSESSSGQ